ncbi:MAG: membrane integrity-associated transporter subunit PqiC [Desulfuromusa sp.]|nr:membrane integrity-associated transporter subunit PqiC [Desulfuromusa sp.]
MRYLLIILLLLCSSCIQVFDDPLPMRYYLLEGVPQETDIASDKALTIAIQLTSFPVYLDRLQIITKNDDNTINVADHDRWAEPIQGNILQTVRENLRIRLPAANIAISPWENSTTDAIKAKIMVNKFSGKLGEHTEVDIRWTIDGGAGEIRQGHFTDRQPIGDSYQDLVAGLNSGINNFSMELAKNLAGE